MELNLTDDDFFANAETIWSSMLAAELTRAPQEDGKVEHPQVTACVNITGEWQGAITVRCSQRAAAQVAATMFEMDVDDLSDDEVRDAMGEIANMTGGGVKAIAPGENTLALPTVTSGEGTLSIPHTKTLHNVVGIYNGEPVVFTVVVARDDA